MDALLTLDVTPELNRVALAEVVGPGYGSDRMTYAHVIASV